jgi:hypothetical protein
LIRWEAESIGVLVCDPGIEFPNPDFAAAPKA